MHQFKPSKLLLKNRVQSLFSWTLDDITNPKPSSFSFKAVIENPKLKVRVIFKIAFEIKINTGLAISMK